MTTQDICNGWGATMDPFGTLFVLSHFEHGYRVCDTRSRSVSRCFDTGFHAFSTFAWVSTAWRMWAGMNVNPNLVLAADLDDGTRKWTTAWSSELACLGMDSVRECILAVTEGSTLVHLDRRDGRVQSTRPGVSSAWTLANGTMHLLALANGRYVITSGTQGVETYLTCASGASALGAAVCGGLVFVSWFKGGTIGYSLETGKSVVRTSESVWLTDIH